MIAIGRLRKDNGEPNLDAVTRSFKMIDKDNDGYISGIELKALLLGMNLDGIDLDNIDDSAEKVLREFDTSGDSRISMDECVQKISKWLHEFNPSDVHHNHHSPQKFYFTHHRPRPIRLKYNFHPHGKPSSSHHRPPPIRFEHRFPKSNAGVEQGNGNPKWIACKAVLILLLGTALAAVFAAPIVDAVDKFATATSIPSFFVSFVILPFASSSDVVPALLLASRKKSAANLTFSEIYRVVTISNILGLSVFLGLIYIRHLTWEFSTEMLIIVIVCTAMGLLASFRTTFHPWMSVVAFALYAFSLALVYVLDYVLGLS